MKLITMLAISIIALNCFHLPTSATDMNTFNGDSSKIKCGVVVTDARTNKVLLSKKISSNIVNNNMFSVWLKQQLK